MKKYFILFIAILSLFLSACSSQNSQVNLKPFDKRYKNYYLENISIQKFDDKVIKTFSTELDTALKGYGYETGDQLGIKYEILTFDKGNRALRYFVGFSAGKATATIKTILENKQKKALGSIITDASLSIGVFGGDDLIPIINAAKDIAKKIHESGILINK